MSKQNTSELDKIKQTLAMLRPGVELTLTEGANPIRVRVMDVRVERLASFIEHLQTLMPAIETAIAKSRIANGSKANVASAIASVLPSAGASFLELVNDCVEPVGAFNVLPPDLAADVLATWLEVNVLDQGKADRMGKAFEPLKQRWDAMFPEPKETSSGPSKG